MTSSQATHLAEHATTAMAGPQESKQTQEVNGLQIALPSYEHKIRCVEDMAHDVHYPSGCFLSFTLSRGRSLAHALSQDPAAPKPLKTKGAKCFTRAQIVEYLSGYGDGFLDISAEISNRLRVLRRQDAKALAKRMAEVEEKLADLAIQRAGMRDDCVKRIKDFSREFVAKYARDITSATDSICGVYFLRSGDEIVYIGQSINVYKRIAEHQNNKTFDGAEFLPCPKAELDNLEGFFTRLLRPTLNGHDEGKVFGSPHSTLWGELVKLNIGGE